MTVFNVFNKMLNYYGRRVALNESYILTFGLLRKAKTCQPIAK